VRPLHFFIATKARGHMVINLERPYLRNMLYLELFNIVVRMNIFSFSDISN
jgi:hypothetical protein